MRRRDFITLLGGAAAAWPLAARAQQTKTPVVAFINGGAADAATRYLAAFQKGLREAGYVEGQNITVEYYWLDGRYEGIPALMADLVRRQVALIATPGSNVAAVAAKTATATIPIVFGSADDPVKLGLVASFARPGGNGTGVNFFAYEVTTKQLGLLKELVPTAARIAVLCPSSRSNSSTCIPTSSFRSQRRRRPRSRRRQAIVSLESHRWDPKTPPPRGRFYPSYVQPALPYPATRRGRRLQKGG